MRNPSQDAESLEPCHSSRDC